MPQLDFITNLSFLQGFLLLTLVGFIYLNDYLNDALLAFGETVFNFFSQAPTFLRLLTSKSVIFFWMTAQHAQQKFIPLKRILSFKNS